MSAFQNVDFLSLPAVKKGNALPQNDQKRSVPTASYTKFCCRENILNEILSSYNLASHALLNKNSFSKIISITGEGGIGKSRLVNEFERIVSAPKASQKTSIDTSHIIRINFSDKNNLIFTKDIDYIRDLIDKKIRASNKRKLPLVVILEDLHWYDSKEKDKIEKLLFASSGELPVLFSLSIVFLTTLRNDPSSFRFSRYDAFEEIALAPFSDEESLKFISSSSLIQKNKLSKNIKDTIVRLSAGIPFYIEEFLKVASLQKAVNTIPPSIKGLLEYKLSFVDPELLKVLEIIAVWDGFIEKETLKNICRKLHINIPESLAESGLIRLEKNKGMNGYVFLHDIYKDFILGRIEKHSKLIYHKTIADLLRKNVDESGYILYKLFYHYKNAEEKEEAYKYLEKFILLSTEKREFEVVLQHIDELIGYYFAIEIKKLEYWLLKIRAYRELIRRDEMGSELEMIEKYIKKHKSSELYLKYLYQFEEFYLLSNDFTKAFRIINKGLALSKKQKNIRMEAEFQFLLARNLNSTGKSKESLKEALNLLIFHKALNDKVYYYWGQYFTAISLQKLNNDIEANHIIEKMLIMTINNGETFFLNIFNKAKAKYFFKRKDYTNYINQTRIQYKIDLSLNDLHTSMISLLNLCDALIVANQTTEAEELLNGLLKFEIKNRNKLFIKRIYEGFFNLKLVTENFSEAKKIGNKLLDLTDKRDFKYLSAFHSNMIEINYNLENLEDCKSHFLKGLKIAKEHNNITNEVNLYFNIGYVFYLLKSVDKAEEYVLKAYKKALKHLGIDYNSKINLLLAEIYIIKGNIRKSLQILNHLFPYCHKLTTAENSFFVVFHKLMIKSFEEKKFKEFISSTFLSNFFIKEMSNDVYKIKTLYLILLVSTCSNNILNLSEYTKLKSLINIKKSKNKTILFYLNQIP